MTWTSSEHMDGFVVGLCGAHGTGKSTILRGVKAAGYKVDETQISREAQKLLGWDNLSVVEKNPTNIWLLQDAVLQAMFDRDDRINKSGEITLVDRTPADIWGYTMLWLMRLDVIGPENREREAAYRRQCRHLASKYAKHIVVPIKDEVAFVAEVNRADAKSREFHAQHVMNFIAGHLDKHVVESISKEDRVKEVIGQLDYEIQLSKVLSKQK